MSDVVERAKAASDKIRKVCATSDEMVPLRLALAVQDLDAVVPELVAEVERLHSWDGLMSLVDEHYPETIFPTGPDREDRDSGPRIVSLLRRLNALLKAAERPDGGTQ